MDARRARTGQQLLSASTWTHKQREQRRRQRGGHRETEKETGCFTSSMGITSEGDYQVSSGNWHCSGRCARSSLYNLMHKCSVSSQAGGAGDDLLVRWSTWCCGAGRARAPVCSSGALQVATAGERECTACHCCGSVLSIVSRLPAVCR